GQSIDRATEDKARSLQVRGVYFLVAKREHKIHYWIERPALTTFDKGTVESVTQSIIGRFKQKQYDDALLKAVGTLTEAANSGPSAPGQGPLARSPGTSRPDQAQRPIREAERSGSFLGNALVIVAVIVGVLLLVRVVAAMMRPAGGGGPGYGYGGGGPGYGFG